MDFVDHEKLKFIIVIKFAIIFNFRALSTEVRWDDGDLHRHSIVTCLTGLRKKKKTKNTDGKNLSKFWRSRVCFVQTRKSGISTRNNDFFCDFSLNSRGSENKLSVLKEQYVKCTG